VFFPTHRKKRDGWGTRAFVLVWREKQIPSLRCGMEMQRGRGMEIQKGVEWKCNEGAEWKCEIWLFPGPCLLVEVDAEEGAFDDHAEDVFEGEVGLLDVHRDLRGDDDDVIA